MNTIVRARIRAAIGIIATAGAVGALAVIAPQAAVAGPTVTTKTYTYTGTTQTFTVPSGISVLTVTLTGGEGGNGGADATPAPPTGGYRGVVTGTIAVTPGQTLTVAVGGGGATGASTTNAANLTVGATGGSNPLGSYGGGVGGKAGSKGSSGFGGAGGAASVLRIGSTDVVAGGGGGNGGSGQFAPTRGRQATATYAGRTDATTTVGQNGTNANDICAATNCSNNDGGGGGAGGGGAQGGAAGAVEFGAGTSNEWFGYGGSVGANSVASYAGLSASYQSYGDNSAGGSIVISYTTGSPAAPTAVSGVAGDASVALAWTAPTDPGQSPVSGYLARYSSDGGAGWSDAVDLGTTGTSGTVSGLTNGTAYIFQVAAVNSVGTGLWSASSASVTPQGPPTAPTISAVVAQDGALGLTVTPPASGATVTGYDYRLNAGNWVSVASPSTDLVIPGLLNGTEYTVEVRAESAVGAGAVSLPVSATPRAVPGAPTISSISAGAGSISVAFTTGFTGGDTITGYEYRLDGAGGWIAATDATSPIVIDGLDAGRTYSVELRAVNGSGAGLASAPASVTTPGLPGAPIVSSVVAGDGSATVTFTPGSTGGMPIDHYEVQTATDGDWLPAGSASPIVLTGLTDGRTYTVSIRAINTVGAGTGSVPVSVTPATTPGAPEIVGDTIAGGDATLPAAFTAPASDGGSPITGYQYSTDGGATWRDRTDGGGTASPVVITALSVDGTTPPVNGTVYDVELRAVNAVGAGIASAVAQGIPTTTPSAPTITTVIPGPGSLGVTFTPGANGGSAITAYEYSIDGGAHWVSTRTLGTTFSIPGLVNGVSYPVQIRATNVKGAGEASAGVDGTPVAMPGRASIDSVVRSNQTLTAAVHLDDDGGSPVTSWQYSTDGGATWATASGTTSPLVLTTLSSDAATRLSNGTGYSLLVRAVTAIGTGPASAATTVAPAAAPAAPSIALTPGDGQVVVAFTLGTDGGSPVQGLDYSLDGTSWTSAGTLASPFTITGLTNGTAYAIRLRADNAIGDGAASVPASTTPRTVPGAPTAVIAGSDGGSADVSWSAPATDGGAAITGYTATAYASSVSATPVASCTTAGATACSITGLTNRTAYYVAVTAANAAGIGAASAPRTIVTPLARPSAPTLSGVTVGDGSLSAAFSAGAIGDGILVGYEYSVDGGATWAAASGTSSPISIVGLTNGTTYHVVLRAVSTAGPGAASTPVDGTPYGYPSAPDPTTIVANGGNGQITVSWAAADLNGGLLGDYTATAFTAQSSGSTAGTCTTSGLSCVIPGLGNGTTYWISLQTRNSVSMYSQRSAPRVPAIPSTRPGAPTGVSAVAADGSATVGWTAPTSTGASAISGYTVLCSTGGSYTSCGSVTGSATSLRVTGLTNGTAYTFEVTATNGSGAGPASAASASVTPLAAGVAPTFGAPSATADGFTVAIANYDAAATYTVSASAGTATRSGATITVSGLDAATASTVTVAAARTGFTTASSTVEGSSLKAGIAPTFSGRTATPTGFTFVIANYDAASDYALTATDGAEVSRDGATVTVSGLALGGASQVTVEVSKAGSTDASGTVSGTAMALGTAPVLAGLVSTDTGFRFEISNYDASLVYSLAAAGGATAARSGSTVTVTGLTDGAASDVTVTVTDPGVSVASAVEHGAALLAGAAPAVSGIVSTVDGFTFHLDLSDAAVAYSALSAPGVVSMAPDGTVTVTGLAPGESADVTISAIQTGHVTATTTVTGSALLTGIAPLFAAPERTSDGFTVAIDNLDADGTYAVSSSSGTATVAAGVIAVTGLAPDAAATVTVTVSHVGYTDGVSTTSGAALAAGAEPTFTDVVPTADGFTFTIADYDASLTYTTQLSPTGVVVIDGSGHGVVSGLAPGTSATLAVTATDPGVSTATATTGATVLLPTAAVQLSAATPLAGGYSFRIVDYDPAVTYSFTQADGGTVVRSGDTVTVSGLGAAVTSATTVSATSAGHTVEVATASGTSFPDGAAPGIGAVTRTLDGFSFTFTADPSASYTAASDAGTVTITGTTVTVTGLAPGATTTVHLTASVPGSLDATSDVAGTAIALGVAPVLGAPVSTAHGFVVVIANYSALTAYRLSTSAGTITRDAGRVTVAGLAAGASATVTVTAVRSGYRDASATQAGSATAPVVRTAPASATVPTPSAPTTSTGTTPTESSDISGPGVPKALQGVDESAPGTGTVQSDGAALPSKLSSQGDRVVLTTRHGFRLTVSGWEHGHVTPIGPHGVIEVLRGGTTRVVVSGLAPDSEIAMWGMSHLQQLVTTRTDHDGALTQLVRLPYSMAPGAHTLIVTGVDTDGGQVTMQVGIRVLPVAHEAPAAPAGGSWWWLLLVALVALLALFAWFVIARRRRQRREA